MTTIKVNKAWLAELEMACHRLLDIGDGDGHSLAIYEACAGLRDVLAHAELGRCEACTDPEGGWQHSKDCPEWDLP